jgi:hypothetical protein
MCLTITAKIVRVVTGSLLCSRGVPPVGATPLSRRQALSQYSAMRSTSGVGVLAVGGPISRQLPTRMEGRSSRRRP